MGKISGFEDISLVPPKVGRMYGAVLEMLEEGVNTANIHVSDITERAGIGKGTAYEYFDSKEEIVACAIVYQIQGLSVWLKNALEKRESFREQILFLMDEIEKKDGQKNCFLRFVHMMTDNAEFSRLVREKLTKEEFAPYMPINIFSGILERGVQRGELEGDLPSDYMVYCLFSHLLTYLLAVSAQDITPVQPAVIRAFSVRGILRELGKRGRAEEKFL